MGSREVDNFIFLGICIYNKKIKNVILINFNQQCLI